MMDFHQIKPNMEKVIVGKSETIDLVLTALLAAVIFCLRMCREPERRCLQKR